MTLMSYSSDNPGKRDEYRNRTPDLRDRPATVNKLFNTLFQHTFRGRGTDPRIQNLEVGEKETELGVTTWRTEEGAIKDTKIGAENSEGMNVLEEAIFYGEDSSNLAADQEKPVQDKYVSREFISEKADIPITAVSRAFKALNAIGDQEMVDIKRPVPRKNTVFIGLDSEAFLSILKHVFQHRFFELSTQEEEQFEHFAARIFTPEKLFYWDENEQKAMNNFDTQILDQMHNLYVSYTANQEDSTINQMKENIASEIEEQFYADKDKVEIREKESNTLHQNKFILDKKLMPLIRKTIFVNQMQQNVEDKSLVSERKLVRYLGKDIPDSRTDQDQAITEELVNHIQEKMDQSDIY